MTGEEFAKWEKKAPGVDYKPVYTALAGGDVEAGVLLSQIIYWFLPSKSGKGKLSVARNGRLWIAKKRAEWEAETGLNPDRFDRALNLLIKAGLVVKATYHFHHIPTLHVSLELAAFLDAMERQIGGDPALLLGRL